MHDDQHGTAVVTLAALINACRVTGLDLHHCKVAQVGLGAAGSAIARLIIAYGAHSVMVTDVNPEMIARLVADGAQAATLDSIMATADVVICTTGKVGLIKPEMIRRARSSSRCRIRRPDRSRHRARSRRQLRRRWRCD